MKLTLSGLSVALLTARISVRTTSAGSGPRSKRPDGPGLTHGDGEVWRGANESHASQRDRVLDPVILCESCFDLAHDAIV